MNGSAATRMLDALHRAQNDLYAGGGEAALAELLAPEITWTVPGDNSIAGAYRGHEEVFEYFRRRRDLAKGTFKMRRRDVLTGEGDRIAALTDGSAMIAGRERRWSTVGLYAVRGGLILSCWLLPLDQGAFDAIWNV